MMITPPPSPLNKVARIEAILALIPAGQVVSYGQVADLAGLARAGAAGGKSVAGDGQDTALASRAGRRGHHLLAQGLGGV